MDIENIKALAEIACAHGLSLLEVCEGETKIRLEKNINATLVSTEPAATAMPVASMPAVDPQVVDFNRLTEVVSPMVGVFYSAPSPDSDPFVSIGSKVKKGDLLCIIETMKLMNEITADQDGEIVDICIKNGDIAEFGQVLFKMF